ncbi:uncharacterized protein J4E79_008762 [Alternaria viburni]|uniref:uncharacterized protein n=1 Tax=Alternaria viburni TaxID=566460 RepID=UPI0020C1EF88|nr:uncharacterized protein J4E79_008762 [Alternaria viburni]KAI4653248.1 hypothetical protein J4E79_008762 [Alternaria viburni]
MAPQAPTTGSGSTFGEARGTVGACRAELARFVGVLVPVVCEPALVYPSTSDESGVVGLEVGRLNAGRSSEVSDGDGGSGVGGLL